MSKVFQSSQDVNIFTSVFDFVLNEVPCPLCLSECGQNKYSLILDSESPLDIQIPRVTGPYAQICESCGDRITDLTHTWDRIPWITQDPDEPTIAVFTNPVDECSFCGDELGYPVLGVELYLHHEQEAGFTDARYSLCEGCAHIFEAFLEGVAESR